MKSAKVLIPALVLLTVSCGRNSKELSTVERGMRKTEVVARAGEPAKKSVINSTELWDYPDSARTVIFRKDTVYAIITSAKARVDSIARWIGKTDNKLKQGFDKAGEKLKEAGKKLDGAGKKLGEKLN